MKPCLTIKYLANVAQGENSGFDTQYNRKERERDRRGREGRESKRMGKRGCNGRQDEGKKEVRKKGYAKQVTGGSCLVT